MVSRLCQKAQQRALLILMLVIGLHLLLDFVYRPWQLAHGFFDAALAGSFTQVTAIIGIAMVMILVESRKSDGLALSPYFFIVVPTLAMIVYEMIQLWNPRSTFDWLDMAYCLVGGLITAWLVKGIVLR